MAVPPPKIVDPANVQALFYKVLERYQIKAHEIKKLKEAIVEVSGFGLFDCFDCPHNWNSYMSWITVDLRDEVITKRWKMKCKKCVLPFSPTFEIEEAEKMIEKAVCRYKNIKYVDPNKRKRDRRYQFVPPHACELCEKCGWGHKPPCWTVPGKASFIT